ncbi:hypothetical protein CU633_12720 [Bacillus sp. V3-13]|uniref:hypothetical protein n=1 Tax=Bacillus sp. V3-13 TaxID=2053728 RepID=UPI000C75DD8D|nr:hypothetical protein [Bacillus sp. V3-13]PLR77070.1 hypothetical protein CU633_12720 [Bacillus sp. V3-13]
MKTTSPKLDLTSEERSKLRKNKIKIKEIANLEISDLSRYLNSSLERAKYLRAMAIWKSYRERFGYPSTRPTIAWYEKEGKRKSLTYI